MLMREFAVKLRPLTSLTMQERQSFGSLYQSQINPGAPFVEGKDYEILAINDRSGGDWSFLISNEYGRFAWVPFDLCLRSVVSVPELPVVPGADPSRGPAEAEEEKTAPRPTKGKGAVKA